MSELPTEYYFIHNFETAVDQPDYVWDMENPESFELYYFNYSYGTFCVLDPDAKFGNYSCHVVSKSYFGMYYEPLSYESPNELTPPLTYEFWFKFIEGSEGSYMEIWLNGCKDLGYDWIEAMYQVSFGTRKGVDTSYDSIATWGGGYDYEEHTEYPVFYRPFSFNVYNHYAIVILPDRMKTFINGILFKEYISGGFNVSYSEFYIDNERGSKLLIDALSITKGEKYTENFNPSAPPEPVFAAPIGQYNEGDHMAYAPGDSGGTAVWREAGTSSTPITDIHRPGCGYWFKEVGTVYGGEVGPWVPWNVDQKVEFNEGSRIVKSPAVSGGTPVWEVGKTGPAITDTHVPCGYWGKKV